MYKSLGSVRAASSRVKRYKWPADLLTWSKMSRAVQHRREEKEELEKRKPVEGLDSLAATRFLEHEWEHYSTKHPEIIQTETQTKPDPEAKEKESFQFPLQQTDSVDFNETSLPVRKRPRIVERGFHLVSSREKDAYVSGTAADLPDDVMAVATPKMLQESVDSAGLYTRPAVQYRIRYGPSDAVEQIEFQSPCQPSDPGVAARRDERDYEWLSQYGSADPSVAASEQSCPGCGAQFHCQDTGLPGFLPVHLFMELEEDGYKKTLCRRCYLLKHHNFLLNVTVSGVDYEAVMGKLRDMDEILLVMIVDMLDLPGSIYKALPMAIGARKPMIVVGNKADLIPPDAKEGYLERCRAVLRRAIRQYEFDHQFNVLETILVSAKTGYNVENLITLIQTRWGVKGDIYLCGCTNTGKSTLFNALLQSDMCKVRATDLIERATTSLWPGTTMSLLKFPIMRPTEYRVVQRGIRLRNESKKLAEERRHMRSMMRQMMGEGELKPVLQGYVGRTFPDYYKARPAKQISFPSASGFGPSTQLPKKKVPDFEEENTDFTSGYWCFDSPGTVSSDQIINLLTLEELIKVVPNTVVRPRSFVLNRGFSLLIGGLGRLQLDQASKTLFCTVFASHHLPVHIVHRNELIEFFDKHLGTEKLVVPSGGKKRARLIPNLEPRSFNVVTRGPEKSVADIVLSSLGWVALSGPLDAEYELRAFTPGAVGLNIRSPSMLPYAVNLRGRRIVGTDAYRVEPIDVPAADTPQFNKIYR